MAQPRRPIHEHNRGSPHRDESDQEDKLIHDSQDSTSDESASDTEEFEEKFIKESTIPERLKKSSSVPRASQQSYANLKNVPHVPKCTSHSKNTYFLYTSALITVLIGVYCIHYSNQSKFCSFENLQKQNPTESAYLWNHLRVGIELILNKKTQKPAVYLFGHHGSKHVFQLIKDIAIHSSSCFGKEMVPIRMESDDFLFTPGKGDDYGHVIQKYRNKIKEGNVILIANLNEIPAEAARALHTICDTHSPISKDAVIFLTLTIQSNKEGNANAIAEETLTELWGSSLDRNELDPLITRVTDEVIILQG